MPQTLLLADDSVTIQRVIELTFAGEDIKVVAVSDGDQAIAHLDSEPPDIVLADVGMPGRNGYDVAEHVKQSPALSHIPVVLLTGAFEPVDQSKATAVGCDAVLAKPFDPQLVIGRVRELLARPRQTSAATVPVEQAPAPAAAGPASPPAGGEPPVADGEPRVDADAPLARDSRVDDYFDRLDAAFASLSNTPGRRESSVPPRPPDLDWLNLYPADDAAAAARRPELAVEPTSFAVAEELATEPQERVAPHEPFEPREPIEPHEPFEPVEPHEPIEPVEPIELAEPGPRALPSIAEAFAAILSAEQNGVRPEWPRLMARQPAPPPAAEPVITDDVIERVARRVLEQLSDRVVRETVAQLASETAERLVHEEIERIKAANTPPESGHLANS